MNADRAAENTVGIVVITLFPHASASAEPRREPAMMAERPSPRWCTAVIRFVQDPASLLDAAVLATAGALFLVMAVRVAIAWHAGRL